MSAKVGQVWLPNYYVWFSGRAHISPREGQRGGRSISSGGHLVDSAFMFGEPEEWLAILSCLATYSSY